MQNNCTKCGSRVSPQDKYCGSCGLKINNSTDDIKEIHSVEKNENILSSADVEKKLEEEPVVTNEENNSFIKWYKYYFIVLKKYIVFTGRTSRAEYWYFFLCNIIIAVVLGIIDGGEGVLVNLYQLIIIIPSIAVSIRRMHDVGKSGWFILIPIYNFILTVTDSVKGDNMYGANPKQ